MYRTVFLCALASVVLATGGAAQSFQSRQGVHPPDQVAKLTCKKVSDRWQLCGDIKPFKKFVVGVGVRFFETDPIGGLTAIGATHTTCQSLAQDNQVPATVRRQAMAQCAGGWPNLKVKQ